MDLLKGSLQIMVGSSLTIAITFFLRNLAKEHRQKQRRLMKPGCPKVQSVFTFKVGDVVLVKNQRKAERKGEKLEPDWKGPYTITEISESYAYVQNSQEKPLANKVSREHLKPFVNSAIPVQMLTPSVSSKKDSPTTVVEDPTKLSILHETLSATRTVPFGLTASRKRRTNSGRGSCVKWLMPLEKTNLVKYLPPTVYTSILQPNYWLNDKTIDYAQGLLSTQFPNIEGFQATVALAGSSVGGYIPTVTDKFVQIVHINGNHWMTISNVFSTNPDTFKWYDSLVNPSNLPQFPQKVAAAMPFSSAERLVVDVMDIQQQTGGSDCRLFAIANATALCYGTDLY